MSLKNPKPGVGFVPEYQVSSWPYVTSSQIVTTGDKQRIQFPGVTRWIQIHNGDHGGSSQIHFGFTENCFLPTNSNYYCLHAGESTSRLELKCKEIWVTADSNTTPFHLIAGYTAISTDGFPVLTGSSGWNGVG